MQDTPTTGLHRALRGVVLAVLAFAAVNVHARIRSERLLAAILAHTPAPTIVNAGAQIRAAEAAAARIPGAEAMWGVGGSMAPLFVSHTAIVVAPIPFNRLQKGMTVVYVARSGEMIDTK